MRFQNNMVCEPESEANNTRPESPMKRKAVSISGPKQRIGF